MGKSAAQKQQVSEYSMSIHLGLCWGPIDAITGLFVGEKLAWQGEVTTSSNIPVSAPNLFGGVKDQGGVGGTMVYLDGRTNQVVPAALAARLGLTPNTCPAYRNIASVFFIGTDGVPSGSIDTSGTGIATGTGTGVYDGGNSMPGTGGTGTGGNGAGSGPNHGYQP